MTYIEKRISKHEICLQFLVVLALIDMKLQPLKRTIKKTFDSGFAKHP